MTMTAAQTLSDTAAAAQRAAADPAAHVFVSANAGSGKTKVLVDRVIRLLLDGADPDKIVCITYTKAAAAEMRSRLFDQLGSWSVLPDDALTAELARLTGTQAPRDLASARRLFARSLETPGGLKIQTIHAFCERVLRRFPLEAGAPAGFVVMDEAEAQRCAGQAAMRVEREALREPSSPLRDACDAAARVKADGVEQIYSFVTRHRRALSQYLRGFSGIDDAKRGLCAQLGVSPDDTSETVKASAWTDTDEPKLRRAMEALHASSTNDKKAGDKIANALAASGAADAFEHYVSVFFTKAGKPVTTLATKPVLAENPTLGPFLNAEAERIEAARAKAFAADAAQLSCAVLMIGQAFVAAYEAQKRAASALDFADLIDKTNALLSDSDAAAWVLYKLDGGVDHLLVDEAQDTSPDQWDLVHALTSEFLSGEGVEGRAQSRTVFAVGDEKQSIYGFQGADPAQFLAVSQRIAAQSPDRFKGVALPVSFRSAPAVLRVVDAVFSAENVAASLTPTGDLPRHQAFRNDCEGAVELWPLIEPAPKQDPADPWSSSALPEADAVDAPVKGSADERLARLVAQSVAKLLADGALVGERSKEGWRQRPVRAGDIMILVRRRTPLFDTIIRRLKGEGVPVAGADRMVMNQQTAVLDILGAARVALLPEDDLALAEFLKTPFLHPVASANPPIDDEALFALAHDRPATLYQTLMETTDERFFEARDMVRDLVSRVSLETPFAFLSGFLDRASATGESHAERLFARLGLDAEDPTREVLDRALQHAKAGAPSLERFVLEMTRDGAAVKRDLAEPGDQVRVMTVHGAKGLEAPIVILPDAAVRADAQFPRKDDGMRLDGAGAPLWSPSKAADPPEAAKLRQADRDRANAEDLRLLYVAMTRAQDRLIVCGADGNGRGGPDSWHGRVAAGLSALNSDPFATPADVHAARPDDENGPLGQMVGAPLTYASVPARPRHREAIEVPEWARSAFASSSGDQRRVSPSRLAMADDTEAAPSPIAEGAPDRFRRGNLIHGLLEILPDLPREDRRAIGLSWLLRQGVNADTARDLVGETLSVINDDRFAKVFAPSSRAEAAISGRIVVNGETVTIDGRVDRLAVTSDTVLIVDYKTNRPPPTRAEDVDPAYLAQLAAYHKVLRQLYPERKIECALLWTFTPALMLIPQTLLDRALGPT